MKILSSKTVRSSAIDSDVEVIIGFARGKEEADELRAALAIVQKYQAAATQHTKSKPGANCDWVMLGMAVKNDCVIINVNAGMAG